MAVAVLSLGRQVCQGKGEDSSRAWKFLPCGFEGLVLVGGREPGRRYMGVCQWARAPGGARAHSIREWLLFIHPAEMTFQMRRIASMQMRGLFNMNDRPLNSYYYMAHCHNYVVHLVSLSPSPSPSSPKGWGTSNGILLPFTPPLPNLLSEPQLCCAPVTVGRGPLSLPWEKELPDSPCFLLRTSALTPPPRLVFVPWGPGVFRSQSSWSGILSWKLLSAQQGWN